MFLIVHSAFISPRHEFNLSCYVKIEWRTKFYGTWQPVQSLLRFLLRPTLSAYSLLQIKKLNKLQLPYLISRTWAGIL